MKIRHLLAAAALSVVATFGSAAMPPVEAGVVWYPGTAGPCAYNADFYSGGSFWYLNGSCSNLNGKHRQRISGKFWHSSLEKFVFHHSVWKYMNYRDAELVRYLPPYQLDRITHTVCREWDDYCWWHVDEDP